MCLSIGKTRIFVKCTLKYISGCGGPALSSRPGNVLGRLLAQPLANPPRRQLTGAFIFERYASLFPGKWAMIVASAAAFAFLHIIFCNWLAVALTFGGGMLYAARYAESGSLVTSSFEHALYGCWLFAVGRGQFFYHGTIATVGSVLRR